MRSRFLVPLSRIGSPLILVGLALSFSYALHGSRTVQAVGFVVTVIGLVAAFLPVRPDSAAPVPVRAPIEGRWIPVNSPADKVPSHGTHEMGQTYAIDLVFQPQAHTTWTAVRKWPLSSRPETFPAFGRPILAAADGVVVRATGWQRDHWSRNSWVGVGYLLVEGAVRQLASLLSLSSARFHLGNHVMVDHDDGVFAVYAHLKRGSVIVHKGQRVRVGDQLGECGNSGNSSEPHLHFHLMDSPRPLTARGLPFTFDYEAEGTVHSGAPGGQRPFTVPAAPSRHLSS